MRRTSRRGHVHRRRHLGAVAAHLDESLLGDDEGVAVGQPLGADGRGVEPLLPEIDRLEDDAIDVVNFVKEVAGACGTFTTPFGVDDDGRVVVHALHRLFVDGNEDHYVVGAVSSFSEEYSSLRGFMS